MLDARQYHNLTSYQRDKIPPHFLDWENQPSTFKTYPDVEFIPLPRDLQIEDEALSDVLKCSQGESKTDVPSLTDLSRILFLANTLTRKAAHGGGLILSSGNSIHSSVKPGNYLAMWNAIRMYGRYPISLDSWGDEDTGNTFA